MGQWGGLSYIFGAAYGTGKAACDRLAADIAIELKPHNVASLSIWPGIVGTEHISRLASELDEKDVADPNNSLFSERYNWETPLRFCNASYRFSCDAPYRTRAGRCRTGSTLWTGRSKRRASGIAPLFTVSGALCVAWTEKIYVARTQC